ncbi:MAG: hypothetical protein AMXMBFR82_35770 [Candidatus Hydrogenedentota bacterium]
MQAEQLSFELFRPKHEGQLHLGPNPYFGDLTQPTRCVLSRPKPFNSDIVAGKNTYVYDAHTYHTKVPPEGIKLLIDYYTRPGDIVLDPFCGSGMTGVAATDLNRIALLSDLSPAAAFIAYNLNTPIDESRYMSAVNELLRQAEYLEESLYDTHCRRCGKIVPMLYMVWSYGYECAACGKEFVLWDVARDEKSSVRDSKILNKFPCPFCRATQNKRGLHKTKRYPVEVGYKCCQAGLQESREELDEHDRETLRRINENGIPPGLWYPTDSFRDGVNTRQPIAAGLNSVNKCYTPRALYAMAYLWKLASEWPDRAVSEKLLFTLTSLYKRVTLFSEFRFWGGSGNTANYNVPGIINEQNVFKAFQRKAKTISWYFREAAEIDRKVCVSVQSACSLYQLLDKSVDYIFTDPPFGGNINYSEMNFLWESWLARFTDTTEEAIVNKVQGKGFLDYENLLSAAFAEARRVLKDGAWLTVVFHNSSKDAWQCIQNALRRAGFEIRGTQTFDKKHGTFKMFVSENAVGYDLVLHCRKAKVRSPILSAGDNHHAVIDFIKTALRGKNGYTTRFLHVKRDDEFDYRRLYSEWLVSALKTDAGAIDFQRFRELVDNVRTRGKS